MSAGTIRNTIWQALEGQKQSIMSDVDIVYYDKKSAKEEENKIEKELYKIDSNYKWQVKNEYYMNKYNFIDQPKFSSLYDAISHFVETPTCVGAYLDKYDNIQLIAPYGIKDLMNLNCMPIPLFIKDNNKLYVYKERMLKKKWKNMFPNLTIYLD
ncbi:nucleotidyltransferase family protein [Apilactobacillus timberlakei]|uniref:nucleotidyltransferase family protein n=1 Tax=Apilactobacillus timberlakei TaxID=2008380 RepID=UPI0015E86696|nr:nucleotidyltransferase family protein [Apilactobacillus timberlakei]